MIARIAVAVPRFARALVAGACVALAALLPGAARGAFTDRAGNDASRAAAAPVFRPVTMAAPTVTGAPRVGATLAASAGVWERQPSEHAYRWVRCAGDGECTPIPGATAAAYVAAAADEGARLRVEVTASNAGGDATALSAPTPAVERAAAPTSTAPPTIAGGDVLGATLSAAPGTWTGDPRAFAYRWLRCDAAGGPCAAVAGRTTAGYVTSESDIGHRLRVEVTATNAAGATTATSDARTGLAPAAKLPPGSIAGTASVGATLSFAGGGWRVNPSLPVTYAREWWRCPSATASPPATCARLSASGVTYAVTGPDVGGYLRVVDVATQNGLEGRVVSLNAVGPVTAASARLPATAQGETGPAYAGNVVGNIADGNWSTVFGTLAANPVRAGQWVRIDFGAVRTLTRYVVEHDIAQVAGHPPFGYVIEASTDLATWTMLRPPSPFEQPRRYAAGNVALPAPVQARYLRLRATTDAGMGWSVPGLDGHGY